MFGLRSSVLLLAAAGFAIQAPPAAAASSKECVSVQLDAPFRLPDGVVRQAGVLTLCDERAYSPVVELHAILVNGASVGMFQSRRRSTEAGADAAPQVLFERESEGTLALVGYVVSSAGRSMAFRLRSAHVAAPAASALASGPPPAAPIAAIIAAETR
jgi:hypothetical protein